MTTCRWILVITRNVSKFIEKIKTHILCSVTFFFFENRDVYEIMSKNAVQPDCRRQYGAALYTGLVRLYARKNMPAPVHPHTHTRAHKRTRTHLHTPINCFFHCNNGFVNGPPCDVIRTLSVLFKYVSKYWLLKKESKLAEQHSNANAVPFLCLTLQSCHPVKWPNQSPPSIS
jgi:hypothetical protein